MIPIIRPAFVAVHPVGMEDPRVRLRAQLGDMNIVGHNAGTFELIAGRLPQVEMKLACGAGLEPAIE